MTKMNDERVRRSPRTISKNSAFFFSFFTLRASLQSVSRSIGSGREFVSVQQTARRLVLLAGQCGNDSQVDVESAGDDLLDLDGNVRRSTRVRPDLRRFIEFERRFSRSAARNRFESRIKRVNNLDERTVLNCRRRLCSARRNVAEGVDTTRRNESDGVREDRR